MSCRNTLQEDTLKPVSGELQSSLAVKGDLSEEDLFMDLARRIVSGCVDEAETVAEVFARARDAEANSEEPLMDNGWKAV